MPKYRIPQSVSKRPAWDSANNTPWTSNQPLFTAMRQSGILGVPGSNWLIIRRISGFVFSDNLIRRDALHMVSLQVGEYSV